MRRPLLGFILAVLLSLIMGLWILGSWDVNDYYSPGSSKWFVFTLPICLCLAGGFSTGDHWTPAELAWQNTLLLIFTCTWWGLWGGFAGWVANLSLSESNPE